MNAHPTSDPPRQRVFGPYSFDEASGELSKHGIRLRLQGQPLKILAMMIRRPGQVVNREEFQKQLWSSSTFVDFEHGLNAAMNRLRQLLGDSADQPRYIETVSGRGYRFIGVIQDPDHGPVLVKPPTAQAVEMGSGSQEEPKVAAPQRRTNWIAWAIGAGAVWDLTRWVLRRKPKRSEFEPVDCTLQYFDTRRLCNGARKQPADVRTLAGRDQAGVQCDEREWRV